MNRATARPPEDNSNGVLRTLFFLSLGALIVLSVSGTVAWKEAYEAGYNSASRSYSIQKAAIESSSWQEGYRAGHEKGFSDGYQQALRVSQSQAQPSDQ